MKKSLKVTSLILVCMLIISAFGGTFAFAASTKFLSFYPTGTRTINVNQQDYFQVLSTATEPPTVKVGDTAKLKAEFDKQIGTAALRTYQYKYIGLQAGSTTVTLTSKDGLTAKETFTVKNSAANDIVIKSDTTGNLLMKQASSYTLKITCATKGGKATKPIVTAGDSKILKVEYLKQSGSNFYYKITAIGKAGQSTGLYAAAAGIKAVKQFTVTITNRVINTSKNIKIKCDTTRDFSLKKGASYVFKITSANGVIPIFTIGTKGPFSFELIKKSGDNYFYRITAVGTAGQSAGIYTTIPNENPVRQCKVMISHI